MRDLCRLLLESTPVVTPLRPHRERAGDRALRVDRHALVGRYRSLLFRDARRRSSPGTARAIYSVARLSERRRRRPRRAHAPRRRAGAGARRGAARPAARPLRHDELERAQQTADLALAAATAATRAGRAERPALRALRGRRLEEYRAWAAGEPLAGGARRGGESRFAIVERYAAASAAARPAGGCAPRRPPLAAVSYALGAREGLAARSASPAGRVRDPVRVHARRSWSARGTGVLDAWLADRGDLGLAGDCRGGPGADRRAHPARTS